jgi:hypothetical protein
MKILHELFNFTEHDHPSFAEFKFPTEVLFLDSSSLRLYAVITGI